LSRLSLREKTRCSFGRLQSYPVLHVKRDITHTSFASQPGAMLSAACARPCRKRCNQLPKRASAQTFHPRSPASYCRRIICTLQASLQSCENNDELDPYGAECHAQGDKKSVAFLKTAKSGGWLRSRAEFNRLSSPSGPSFQRTVGNMRPTKIPARNAGTPADRATRP
jgi:hypothetical protein